MPLHQPQPYSKQRLNFIYNLLLASQESGHEQDYEILLDGFKVVHRTSDPEKFWNFEEVVTSDNKELTVVLYEGTSRKNAKHVYRLQETTPTPPTGLNGTETGPMGLGELVAQEVNKFKAEFELERLREALAQAQERIEELEEEKQSGLEQMKPMAGLVGNALLHGLMKSPILASLTGGLQGLPAPAAIEPEEVPSFVRKGSEPVEPVLSEQDRRDVVFAQSFRQLFTREEVGSVMQIVNILAAHKGFILPVLEDLRQHEQSITPQS